jgi:transcriptional regulator with XRE-family HTH domain
MNLLQEARRNKNLSIKEAATLMGIDGSTLQRVETGKQFPKEKTLLAIAKVYKIKPSEVLDCYLKQKQINEKS